MSKIEIIELIREINTTATEDFLESFSIAQLDQYLENLLKIDLEAMAICA